MASGPEPAEPGSFATLRKTETVSDEAKRGIPSVSRTFTENREIHMFRKLLITAAATAVLGGVAAPAMAATADTTATTPASSRQMVGTTMHANLVSIYPADANSGLYEGLSFTPSGDYSISSGQPWGGVTTGTGAFDALQITAQAGRHDSSGPAEFFTQNTSAMIGGAAYGDTPSELNFAFTGTLTVDGNSYDLVVGQGSNMDGNNWWFGGEGWTQVGAGQINTPDDRYTLMAGKSQEAFTLAANS